MNIYESDGGAQVYQIPLHEFPGLMGNIYFIALDHSRVLVDSGSGFGVSNQDIELGLEEISDYRKEECSLRNIDYILITHGHIDHFGGLPYIKNKSNAKICIHELDRRTVSNHEERLSMTAHRLGEFLTEAGVTPDRIANLLEMYKLTKSLYQSVNVDITYETQKMQLGPFKFIHVPGHCAGHVLIKLHDILFCGDHILEKTSPHQAPEQITLSTGLDTYLHSLEVLRVISKNMKYFLGGHENPIQQLEMRIQEIRLVHNGRLQNILIFLSQPHTIAEISKHLFGKVDGYTILLALEEAGAHVEYLYQRGFLEIANLQEVAENPNLIPIKYRSVNCEARNILSI
jgi:glyoxylase-like metal-dependent hydrolase (beta-lactamase superfamily II)